MADPQKILDLIVDRYREIVTEAYPGTQDWPILTGFNAVQAKYGSALVLHLIHTGLRVQKIVSPITTLSRESVGADQIERSNRSEISARLENHFRPGPKDILLVFENALTSDGRLSYSIMSAIDEHLRDALVKHELALGSLPMKIFLSHKGFDKPKVRNYRETLKLLGFDPWLDEDAMPAGTNLERGILKGFEESCAAVFFVTPSYVDENYLATKVEYAIAQKRKKRHRFTIVTLVFQDAGKKGSVPELLRPFVWKKPADDLEGLREVIRALPVSLRGIQWGKLRP